MATLSNLTINSSKYITQSLVKLNTVTCRFASKKTASSGGLKNAGKPKPKHRGWKKQDGAWAESGNILATQNTTRFHPGLNVGFGRNGTLFAVYPGRVVVTAEKISPNWKNLWIQRCYGERKGQVIYKKHFNVITEPEHKRFKLIDKI